MRDFLSRDGRLLVGDEIVNVNGRRLRGLPMSEAKAILRSSISPTDFNVSSSLELVTNSLFCRTCTLGGARDVDIVVARKSAGESELPDAAESSSPDSGAVSTAASTIAEEQPLSLLARHDEQASLN